MSETETRPAGPGPDDLDPVAARTSRPVFIWAPAARCGITLLQRLISSSREIIVFGELDLLGKQLPKALLEVSSIAEESRAARERLAAGDVNFWASPALPHSDLLVAATIEAFYGVVAAFDASARADGFARWGTKLPAVGPGNTMQVVQKLLPHAQHVWMLRHVEDVMRSYKSRRWLPNVVEVARVAQTWVASVEALLALPPDPRVLVLRHEELAADGPAFVERLRAFLGVARLDAGVLDHRINTFRGEEARGHAPDEYIRPAGLTDDERQVMYGIVGERIAATGYERRDP